MFKVISLIPQDKGKSSKIISASSNTIALKAGNIEKTLKFDQIFNNLNEASDFVSFDRPIVYLCFCAKSSFTGENLILNSIRSLLSRYLSNSNKQNNYINIFSLNSSSKQDLQASKNGSSPRVNIKSMNEVEMLLNKIIPKVAQAGRDGVYITLGDRIVHKFFFIPVGPVKNRVIFDTFQAETSLNPNVSNDVLCSTILQAIESGSNSNIYMDLRLSNVDGIDDNSFIMQLGFAFSKFMGAIIPKFARRGENSLDPDDVNDTRSPISKSKTRSFAKNSKNSKDNKNDYQWRKFVTRKRVENGQEIEYIDKDRLSHIAKKAACDPKCGEKELMEILRVLNNEIVSFEQFRSTVGEDLKKLNKNVKTCKVQENKLKRKLEEARNTYIKLRTQNNTKKDVDDSVTYGNYTLDDNDYKFAYECLKDEVYDLEDELEFLRIAFPENVDSVVTYETENSEQMIEKPKRKPVVSFAPVINNVEDDENNGNFTIPDEENPVSENFNTEIQPESIV